MLNQWLLTHLSLEDLFAFQLDLYFLQGSKVTCSFNWVVLQRTRYKPILGRNFEGEERMFCKWIKTLILLDKMINNRVVFKYKYTYKLKSRRVWRIAIVWLEKGDMKEWSSVWSKETNPTFKERSLCVMWPTG